MIPISDTVDTIMQFVGTFSQNTLSDSRMLAMLLQCGHDTGRSDLVGELAFKGKYLHQLFGTMQKQMGGDHYEKLEEEFSRSVLEFQDAVARLVQGTNEDMRIMIEHHYLSVSPVCLKHTLELASDFRWLKDWELAMSEQERK